MFTAALIYILAVISPGPNFLLVSRFSSSSSFLAGVGATLGIVMVGLLFSISSVTGLALLINQFPWFNRVAAIAGSVYLLYIAAILIKGAFKASSGEDARTAVPETVTFWQAWRVGVMTNVLNVKTIAFMISIFAGFLVVERTTLEKATVIAICSSLEFTWYASVALVFGQGPVRRFYMRYNKAIDVVMALMMVVFAVRTAIEA